MTPDEPIQNPDSPTEVNPAAGPTETPPAEAEPPKKEEAKAGKKEKKGDKKETSDSAKASPDKKEESPEDKKKEALAARKKLPFWLVALKQGSIVFTIVTLSVFFALVAALDKSNQYLSLFGMEENTYLKHKRLKAKKDQVDQELLKLSFKISELQDRLKNREFFVHRKEVKEIKDNRLTWVDRIDDEGKQVFGILDSVERMKDYFNSARYENPILAGNQIKMEKMSANRKKANFSIIGKNIFGKIFFLNAEFTEMVNSFPFFKNGEIKSYTRKPTKSGDDEMNFALSVEIQKPNEEDPFDVRLTEYTSWLAAESTFQEESNKKPKKRGLSPKKSKK